MVRNISVARLLGESILLIAIILLFNSQNSVVNAAAFPGDRQENQICTETCTTSTCNNEAKFLLDNMNQDVDPCENFYEFACGNYVKNVVIPEDKNKINMFQVIDKKLKDDLLKEIKSEILPNDLESFKKMKTHYQNCINETRIEEEDVNPFLDTINKVGGWPLLLEDKWDEDSYNWKQMIDHMAELRYQPRFPFSLAVTFDSLNSSHKILGLYSAQTRVSETYFLEDSENLEAYEAYMVDIAVMLGAKREVAAKELKKCLDFEVKLFKIQTIPEVLFEIPPSDTQKTIKALSQEYPTIPWLDFLNTLLKPSNVKLNESEVLEVSDLKFVEGLEKLLANTPKRVLANYQIWQLVYDLIDYMPKRFIERQLNFNKVIQGVSEVPEREVRCIDEVMMVFGIAVSSMYVREHFNKDAKNSVTELVDRLREQTKLNIENIDWMDDGTRKIALTKLEKMKSLVAYPEELFDDEKVDNYYKYLDIEKGSYLHSISSIAAFITNLSYVDLRTPVGKDDWISDGEAAVVNAFYEPTMNKIVIPAGILNGIFYQFKRPEYLNYGGIGTVIGHEITHGFDSTGRKYDEIGNYNNWWKNDTESKYLEKSKCMVEQYSNYTIQAIGLKVNGNLTLGENIADNGGVKLAYRAYNEWAKRKNVKEPCLPNLNFTPQQMFWISAATNWCGKSKPESLKIALHEDTHSPLTARVNVVFSNIDEFANDFQCKLGTKINPVQKCNVW